MSEQRLMIEDFEIFAPQGGMISTYCGEVSYALHEYDGRAIGQVRKDLIEHLIIKTKPRMRNGHTRRGNWYTGDLEEMERRRQESIKKAETYWQNLSRALDRGDWIIPAETVATRSLFNGMCALEYDDQTPEEMYPGGNIIWSTRVRGKRRGRRMPPMHGPHVVGGLLPYTPMADGFAFSGFAKYKAAATARGIHNRLVDIGDRGYLKTRLSETKDPLWQRRLLAVELAQRIIVGEEDAVMITGKVGHLANPHPLMMIPEREQLAQLIDELYLDAPEPPQYYDPTNPPTPPNGIKPCPLSTPYLGF